MITVAWLRLPIPIASLILGGFSFLVTFFLTPYFIDKFKKAGITGKDMNKKDKPEVVEMGGIAIIAGFVASLLPAISVSTGDLLVNLLALLSVTLLVSTIGIFDDILDSLGGITQWQHALLPLIASFPLIALRIGNHTLRIPVIGTVDFGLLYPFLLIPLGITCAANAVNMLGGLNGLRLSLAGLISGTLGIVGILRTDAFTATISFALTGAILAFLYYNWYPAKVFPGDTGTLGVGAIIAAIIIIANLERVGALLFLLFIIEFFLKARSKFEAESFGEPQEDGTLKPKYDKTYSLTHLVMNLGDFNEKQISLIIIAMQVVVSLGVLIIVIT